MKSKDTMHVSEYNQTKPKAKSRAPAQKKVQTAKEQMSLETTDMVEALSAITINSKAETVLYDMEGKWHEFTLKSDKSVWQVTVRKVSG